MARKFFVSALGVCVLALVSFSHLTAQQQDVRADYARAQSLAARIDNKIIGQTTSITWIDATKVSYRRSVTGGFEFIVADAATATKMPAFDHARLATAISAAAGGKYTAVTLPFQTFAFADTQAAITFSIGGGQGRAGGGPPQGAVAAATNSWRCTLTDYTCARFTPPAQGGGGGRQGGGGAGQGRGSANADAPEPPRVSPDRKQEAYVQNYNVFVRPVGGNAQSATQLSFEGSEGNAYRTQGLVWSPDSKKIAAYRVTPGYTRLVHYVESSPADQVQPKYSNRPYPKPGDVLPMEQPVVFNLELKRQFVPARDAFPNAYAQSPLLWREDSRAVHFEHNPRGHQSFKVIEVDATTGAARAVIDDQAKTFFSYYGKKYRFDVNDGREVIWMSERDGWNHLYLYDGLKGTVKNQITKGQWVVRGVERVDQAARQVYFMASGMHAGKDPYLIQYFRVNFDGTGLTPLTTEDGNHTLTFSRDNSHYVDTWSRVDAPPVMVLKRTSDQKVVLELERADIKALLATGWRAPEVFSSTARDGKTDIWGIIIRPTNFDPKRRYPVIEYIYAGPHSSFVPKTFSTQLSLQAQAELGFIVVQIDGLGTSNRSKAFHDYAWKNIKDAGFPDRILWHRAVAAKYPYYDVSRVGIYGHSAGGQNAMGALLFHPEFYKVAVSSCGCHDNRMDKISWNEQWMGWPIGPEYAASSNVDNAPLLKGRLFLSVGELDTNVDPASTLQVAAALIRANKDFDFLILPGQGHSAGGSYGERKRFDYFVRHLRHIEPPAWNESDPNAAGTRTTGSVVDEDDDHDVPAPELKDPFWRRNP
jgi:dipeptidyl aminopeptidase/acylaminoacyl peptidase